MTVITDAPQPPDMPPLEPPAPPSEAGAGPAATTIKKAGTRKRKPAAKKRAAAPDATPRVGRPARNNLKKRLQEQLGSLGLMVSIVSPSDGAVVLAGAENLADSLDKLAAENPSVQRTLERVLTAGAWSGVIAATMPIVVGIAANHDLIPPVAALLIGDTASAGLELAHGAPGEDEGGG